MTLQRGERKCLKWQSISRKKDVIAARYVKDIYVNVKDIYVHGNIKVEEANIMQRLKYFSELLNEENQ